MIYLYLPNEQAQDVLTWGRHIEVDAQVEGIHGLAAELRGPAAIVVGPKRMQQRLWDPHFIICRTVAGDTPPPHAVDPTVVWPTWDDEGKTWVIATATLEPGSLIMPRPLVEPVPAHVVPIIDSTTIERWTVNVDADHLLMAIEVAEREIAGHTKSFTMDLTSEGPHQPWCRTRAEWLLGALKAQIGMWALKRLHQYDANHWYRAIGTDRGAAGMCPSHCWALKGLRLCGNKVGSTCFDVVDGKPFECIKPKPQAAAFVMKAEPVLPTVASTVRDDVARISEACRERPPRTVDADELRKVLHERVRALLKRSSEHADAGNVAEVNFACGEANGVLWAISQIVGLAEEGR